jgi:hypothetical protein
LASEAGNLGHRSAFSFLTWFEENEMGRGILLWLLGVPIPIILLLWLFFGH